jgi:hypothetical protein
MSLIDQQDTGPAHTAERGLWAQWTRVRAQFRAMRAERLWQFWIPLSRAPAKPRYTADFVSLVEGFDSATLDHLIALSAIECARQEHLLRTTLTGYLTIPATIAAILVALAREQVMELVRDPDISPILVAAAAGSLFVLFVRVVTDWRERALRNALETIALERSYASDRAPSVGPRPK